MSNAIEDLTRHQNALTATEAAFDREHDTAARQAELREKLAPFDPGGPLEYAPPDARRRAEDDIRRKQGQRGGEALFVAEHTARAIEMELEPQLDGFREPPDAETAHAMRSNIRGISLADKCGLDLLDEHRRARFDRDLAAAKPSVILAAYKKALADATDQVNASLIRWVESRHGQQGTGVAVGNDASEAMLTSGLHAQIQAAREARIPEDVRAVLDSVRRVYRKADAAKDGGVRSLRPAGWSAGR